MQGRVIKFTNHIDNIDDFINNIVYLRPNNEIYLSANKIKLNSCNEGDFIFFQKEGIISHYTTLKTSGPKINHDIEYPCKISINNVVKMENPINSFEYNIKGQGYNKLLDSNIKTLLEEEPINNYTETLFTDNEWYDYFIEHVNQNTTINNVWNLIPNNRIMYLKSCADLSCLSEYEDIMYYFGEIFRDMYKCDHGYFINGDCEEGCELL